MRKKWKQFSSENHMIDRRSICLRRFVFRFRLFSGYLYKATCDKLEVTTRSTTRFTPTITAAPAKTTSTTTNLKRAREV